MSILRLHSLVRDFICNDATRVSNFLKFFLLHLDSLEFKFEISRSINLYAFSSEERLKTPSTGSNCLFRYRSRVSPSIPSPSRIATHHQSIYPCKTLDYSAKCSRSAASIFTIKPLAFAHRHANQVGPMSKVRTYCATALLSLHSH